MTLNKLFVTVLGSGLSPKAPGTAGSFAALLLGVLWLLFLPKETLLMATLAVSVVGIFEIDRYQKLHGTHDPGEIVIDELAGIVIDELAGMWLAMILVPFTIPHVIAAFFAFRLFDIWKPSIIGRVDRSEKGGLSVMGDDLLAGFLAGVLVMAVDRGVRWLSGGM